MEPSDSDIMSTTDLSSSFWAFLAAMNEFEILKTNKLAKRMTEVQS